MYIYIIRHHYNCGRTDTKFWKDINNSKLPSDLIKILKSIENDIKDDSLIYIQNKKYGLPSFGKYNYQIVDLGHKSKTKVSIL